MNTDPAVPGIRLGRLITIRNIEHIWELISFGIIASGSYDVVWSAWTYSTSASSSARRKLRGRHELSRGVSTVKKSHHITHTTYLSFYGGSSLAFTSCTDIENHRRGYWNRSSSTFLMIVEQIMKLKVMVMVMEKIIDFTKEWRLSILKMNKKAINEYSCRSSIPQT